MEEVEPDHLKVQEGSESLFGSSVVLVKESDVSLLASGRRGREVWVCPSRRKGRSVRVFSSDPTLDVSHLCLKESVIRTEWVTTSFTSEPGVGSLSALNR